MSNLFSVKGKVVVITGGCGILGSCMVHHLTSEGARLAILDRDKKRGEELVNEVKSNRGEAIFLETDVLNKEVLELNRTHIMAYYGTIDVLINAAGGNMPGATIAPDKTIFDLNMGDFEKVVDLNLYGTVLPTLVFGKVMAENEKGSIVNISSESALRPLTRVVGYGTAKAAVTNFTKYLAAEMAIKFGSDIRVNAMAPGFFLTEQNRTLLTNPDGTYTERARSIIAHTPAGRFGKPEELLGTLQWLISDASKFVTGTVVVIDGGFDAFSI